MDSVVSRSRSEGSGCGVDTLMIYTSIRSWQVSQVQKDSVVWALLENLSFVTFGLCRHLKLCHSMAEVNKVPAPKVRILYLLYMLIFWNVNKSTAAAPFLSQSVCFPTVFGKKCGQYNFPLTVPGWSYKWHSGLPKGKTIHSEELQNLNINQGFQLIDYFQGGSCFYARHGMWFC